VCVDYPVLVIFVPRDDDRDSAISMSDYGSSQNRRLYL